MGPLASVVPLAFERLDAGDLGNVSRGQAANGGDQKSRRHGLAGLGSHPPEIGGRVILGRRDARLEADIAAQAEAVSDVIEVAQDLRLLWVALGPLPFLLQL